MPALPSSVPVWDPFVRFFHWTLGLAFALAWASAEEWSWLHDLVGYTIMILVILRLAWGLVGTRHARFTSFLHSPAQVLAYLRGLALGRPRHYTGHNPAGGWMVVALLAMLLVTGLTGILLEDGGDGMLEELHEGAASLTLLLVGVHVAGVLISSLLHGENLVRAMWTGRKTAEHEDA